MRASRGGGLVRRAPTKPKRRTPRRPQPRLELVALLAHPPARASSQLLSSSTLTLALEAIEVASASVRRLMRCAHESRNAIESEAKRHRRLAARLRAGESLRDSEARFVAGALAIMSALHLTTSARAGGRGKGMAQAFERAAEELASLRQGRVQTPQPARMALPLVVGTRVREVATGCVWWIDELHAQRRDLVGVIPDEGEPIVQWRSPGDFVPAEAR